MKKIISLLMLLLVGLSLLSCGNPSSKADTLVYGIGADPINLDPTRTNDTTSNGIIYNMCEGLISYEGEKNTHLVPKLAKSWDVSNDGLTYTFHLREGVKFHDGTPFNADAVLFSYNRQNDVNNKYYKKGIYYWEGVHLRDIIESMSKVDDYTFVMKLNKKDSTILPKFAITTMFIISPTAYEKKGMEEFNKGPVCTGPFVFKKWDRDQMVLLETNKDYWDKEHAPKINKVIFKIIKDASARMLALKKGELDIAENITPQDIKELEKNDTLMVDEKASYYQDYLEMNHDYKPFSDVRVRRAIAHLVPKQQIVDVASMGYGSVPVGPIPTTMWGYDSTQKDYDYNVEEAKKLLAEAGYPNGFDMVLAYNQNSSSRKSIAEILQNEFAKANIKVSIENYEWGTFLKKLKNREFNGAAISGCSPVYVDPASCLVFKLGSVNAKKPGTGTGWINKEFDDAIVRSSETNDMNQRIAEYKTAQKVFLDQIPAIIITEKTSLFGVKKVLKGFQYLPISVPLLRDVTKS